MTDVLLNNIYTKKVDELLSTFCITLKGLGIIIVMLMKKGEKSIYKDKNYYFYDGLLIIVFLNMEYTYNNREELEIGVNTMITLEQKLEQYTHTYALLKGELKWKTSDSRTGMMIAAMYTGSDKLFDLGRF